MKIEICENGCITNDPCAFCGARCDPVGLDFFEAGTWALVCDECAAQYAPELVKERDTRLQQLEKEWEKSAKGGVQ